MPVLYFSYSMLSGHTLDSPEFINSPYSLTWNVGRFLRQKAADIGYDFEYRNLDDTRPVEFGPDDIAVGHTWFDGGFMHQALDADIRAALILQPYSACMVSEHHIPMVLDLWGKADHLLLITGPYWWDTMKSTPYAPLQAKATRLDMAVNAAAHPYMKRRWNKPGKRGFLAIGTSSPAKGMDLIAELARTAGFKLGVYGDVHSDIFQHVPQVKVYGGVDFRPERIQAICDEYDFFLSLARCDANPTTLLETMCWGLVGACNCESGYWEEEPFEELQLNDLASNWKQIDRLQSMSEHELQGLSIEGRLIAEQGYTWERFCNNVWAAVECWL